MKTIIFLVCFIITTVLNAEEVLSKISWNLLPKDMNQENMEIAPPSELIKTQSLKITNQQKKKMSCTILTIDTPKISSSTYAVRGQVRYEGVEEKGFLEMLNYFPKGQYFSRTLEESGGMKHLEGSSDWRPFILPFINGNDNSTPSKLIIRVILPSRGTVWVGPLEIVQFARGESMIKAPGQWWDSRQGGLLGGCLGGIFGLCGAIIGVLTQLGSARSFVMGLVKIMLVSGVVSFIAGIVALMQGQHYAVWYPLFLIGIILPCVYKGLIRTIKKRYEELELQKIRVMDVQ